MDDPTSARRDAAALSELVAAFGWPHRTEDLELLFAHAESSAIHDDGRLVAFGARWRFGDSFARVGSMAVDPSRQGQRLGTRILSELLDGLDGVPSQLTATTVGLPLYRRLGFEEIGGIRQMQGVVAADAAVVSDRVRPATGADRAAVLALDADGFGADRRALVSSLMDVGETFVLDSAGALDGYVVRRSFGRGVQLGPIVAESEAAAIELVQHAVPSGFVRADVPMSATDLAATLAAIGMAQVDEGVEMLRGSGGPKQDQVFGQSSQATG